MHRLTICVSCLRRKKYIFEHLSNGTLKPKVGKVFALSQIVEAYWFMDSNDKVGKIVVKID
ncbi:zinc-binding dehydrogenase [Ralstonia solanacearum]|uniref:zinc-binding dehydrogenase n=1 Tax=Ralstonia solanacearum TaxID=305 RepID=UPI0009BA4BBA|nr:zinc-binding dehydrogenase [Ralstonia solanacearum]MDB0564665.1 zinc-binding dehydrogenase [Ralstonia solanacearum]MDB0575354.1 zinc-binding dehydrogenase [Ralstonia solanacearum]